MAYPKKFREHILKIQGEKRLSNRETAERFCIGTASLSRWKKRKEIKKRKNGPRKINLKALAEDIEKYPDAYQYERSPRLNVSQRTVCNGLKYLRVTYKKNPFNTRRQTLLPEKFLSPK